MRTGIILLCVGIAIGASTVFSAFQFTGDSHSTPHACTYYTNWAESEPVAIETARVSVLPILQKQLDAYNSLFTLKEKACGQG